MSSIMIEIISRALIIKDEKILLCKAVKDTPHYYLPGGHVEFGESAESALKREFVEETGVAISNLAFVGVFENQWGKVPPHHEYNLIFTATLDSQAVVSKEEHIEFEWIEIERLDKLGEFAFLPAQFLERIIQWCGNRENIYLSTFK